MPPVPKSLDPAGVAPPNAAPARVAGVAPGDPGDPGDPGARGAPGLGVYVHFPWCLQKCPYCDFLSFATDPSTIPHAAYADAVISELTRRARDLGPRRLKSVFFGGGTPSLWASGELARVLAAIQAAFEPAGAEPGELPSETETKTETETEAEAVECTAECNPSSFNEEKARQLILAGINRVSIGVQSLNRARLQFLGRLHDGSGALDALNAAIAAGMPRVNADLIFGVAGQSVEDAIGEARAVADVGVTHVSAYALTIEPGTQFGADAAKGRLPLLGEDAVADSFLGVSEILRGAGFEHYEISNFARDGHTARHNLGYWRGDDYLGLGCGAWGTVTSSADGADERVRYRNTPSPERYLAGAGEWRDANLREANSGALQRDVEPIDAATALRERLMLGLRLADGLDVERAARDVGAEPWPEDRARAVERLLARGRLERCEGRLRVPRDQWLFADGTIAELL